MWILKIECVLFFFCKTISFNKNIVYLNYKVYQTKRESHWVVSNDLMGESLLNSASCLLPFLPAAGLRSNSNGELYNVGANGNYWSGSLSSVYSYNLAFNGSDVYPANNNGRANGFSVRCISALNGKPCYLFLCSVYTCGHRDKFVFSKN
ncbi:hypothetical protein D0T49_04890 [Paludibacter sp. 221]|nr:hypothetical protein [Paludibacter sp. 221]